MSHYYNSKTAEPCHFVDKTDGTGLRPTTIRDARKLGLVPSYSTIVSLLNKEGVHRWYINLLLKACQDWPYKENFDKWKKDIFSIADKEGTIARERGTKIHDEFEKYYKKENELTDTISKTVELITKYFEVDDWISEKRFVYDGYGGTVDLYSPTALETGVVLDFKTKDIEDIRKVTIYDEQCMQPAAYRMGLGLPHAKCYNIFLNIRQPDKPYFHGWPEVDLQRTYKMFQHLKQYWYLSNKMEIN